jgi:mono/diheme cytochrome c family protein
MEMAVRGDFMRSVARWLGYGLGIVLVVALLFAGWVWLASWRAVNRSYEAAPERLPVLAAAQLADGPRLIRVFGCVDCHGEGLSGRLMFDQAKVARVWAPNLTLVAAEASDEQLAQAIRQGIGRDGHALWIMPSSAFSRLSAEEVAAIVATLRGLKRSGRPQPDIELGPLGRFGIAIGKFEPAPAAIEHFRARQPFYVDRDHERGRQIAAKTCSDCHGPDLKGGQPGFERTPPDLMVAGAYGAADFRRLIRTGRSAAGRDLGLMGDVARKALSALRDDEIDALHAYLKARAERSER